MYLENNAKTFLLVEAAQNVSEPEIVAGVIWTAVTDGSDTLRYRAGDDAVHLLDKRKVENDETFFSMFKST
tara:strand:+ start:91 stop:303 length:213 start_codon:yes stop_codon:yes gene_type:complete